MKENTLYYLKSNWKTWCITVSITGMMLFSIIANPNSLKNFIQCFIFAMIFIYIIRKNGKYSLEKKLQSETSKDLCYYYDKIFKSKTISKLQNDMDAYLVHSKAQALCYYGEFDRARQILSEIN